MSTAAGVWIAAVIGLSAPVTAAILTVALKSRGRNCELSHATKARVDVLEAGANRTDERLKGIDKKLEALATIEAQLTLLVKHNGGS